MSKFDGAHWSLKDGCITNPVVAKKALTVPILKAEKKEEMDFFGNTRAGLKGHGEESPVVRMTSYNTSPVKRNYR